MGKNKDKPDLRPVRQLQFSQSMVVTAFRYSMFIVTALLIANFVLAWRANQVMTQEAVAAITTFGGVMSGLAFSAYSLLTAARSWSENKHIRGKEIEIKSNSGGNADDNHS